MAERRETSGSTNEFIGKTTTTNKVYSNKKISKGVSSHNIHGICSRKGVRSSTARRGWRAKRVTRQVEKERQTPVSNRPPRTVMRIINITEIW